jgi:gamma-glutamylcyclotransferase (GGCT)/AIG2-like uncharacterized protein YtfP
VRGRLYDLGPYPALKAGRGRVVGDVYRVGKPSVFRVLDRYEANFVRERCVVKLTRGGLRRAWVYRYRRSVARAVRITSGDYRLHRS